MRILLINDGETDIFDDEDEFLAHCQNEEVDFDYNYYGKLPEAFYLPNDLVRLRVEKVPSRYRIANSQKLDAPAMGTLPAPFEGETVGEYARRITDVPATMNLAEDH